MTAAIVGPTASGKTALALAIAPALGAEIVVCDSMTIYRGMDVGTAKPTPDEQSRVPHHLIDIADPSEDFTVARFQAAARDAIDHITARGARPLVVGGSGLYLRAIVDGLSFPPTDPAVRAGLESEPTAALADRLRARDPEALTFVDAGNRRRVVRALEVIEVTGRPFSSFRGDWERRSPVPIAGLDVPSDLLGERIVARLRAQLDAGLLEEAARVRDAGMGRTARGAIPYPDALDLLDGKIDEDTFIERAARANKRLARRQRSWFRADPRVRWFDATDLDRAAEGIKAYFLREEA